MGWEEIDVGRFKTFVGVDGNEIKRVLITFTDENALSGRPLFSVYLNGVDFAMAVNGKVSREERTRYTFRLLITEKFYIRGLKALIRSKMSVANLKATMERIENLLVAVNKIIERGDTGVLSVTRANGLRSTLKPADVEYLSIVNEPFTVVDMNCEPHDVFDLTPADLTRVLQIDPSSGLPGEGLPFGNCYVYGNGGLTLVSYKPVLFDLLELSGLKGVYFITVWKVIGSDCKGVGLINEYLTKLGSLEIV